MLLALIVLVLGLCLIGSARSPSLVIGVLLLLFGMPAAGQSDFARCRSSPP